jgi:hypothetical protein
MAQISQMTEGKGLGPPAEVSMCLAPVIRHVGTAPKGQERLPQGLPWVSRNERFALKGLEIRTRSASKVRSRFSRYLIARSGLFRLGELPRVNLGLCFLGHFGPRTGNVQTVVSGSVGLSE